MTPIRLDVTAERSTYPILIGPGSSRGLEGVLETHGIGTQRLLVSAPPIWRPHGARFRAILAPKTKAVLIGDGERAKTLRTVSELYDACVARGLDRSAAIIAVGGGVVGDVAGFAAASYLRGITVVQIPTTLLAQVDSSVGGKVGVNLRAGKNLVGAFHAPKLVVCDPELLKTLPRREFRSGLYEVVKYGVISSRRLFEDVGDNLDAIFAIDPQVLTQIVAECCRIKAEIVMSDERESGPRRVLNFGHTIGHALEAITDYRRFRHGEAIGYGMLAAARLSVMRGALDASAESALSDVIRRMGPLPPVNDLRIKPALDAITRDKKVVDGRLHFVIATDLGATAIISDVTTRELAAAMKHIGMRA